MQPLRTFIVALLLLAVVAPSAEAAAPEGPALAKTATPLLGGRVSVRLPQGMRVEARDHGIMAAPEAPVDETRAVLDEGGVRLVLMAWELYALGGDDFAAAIDRDRLAAGETAPLVPLEPLTVPAPAQAFAAAPPVPDPPRDGNRIYEVYVRHADGAVLLLAFYLAPEGLKERARWTALARAVAETLAPGTRTLARPGGPTQLRGMGKDALALVLPQGFVATTQEGPDFVVHRLRELVALGVVNPLCGIYLGGHPSYQHDQLEVPAANVKASDGLLLGQRTAWHSWASDSTAAMTEAIAPIAPIATDPLQASLAVHVFCSGATPAEADRLRRIVETMRVVPGTP